jgi:hypothetical protein
MLACGKAARKPASQGSGLVSVQQKLMRMARVASPIKV